MLDTYLTTIQESTDSDIEIKDLPINNINILGDLFKEFVRDTSKKTKFKNKKKTLNDKKKQLLGSVYHKVLVAYDDNRPIAYMFGTIDDKFKSGVLNGAIAQLVVSKQYRGKGIAKDLWAILDKWFNDKNVKIKWVSALYNNKEAIGLYKSFGFIEDQLIMRK